MTTIIPNVSTSQFTQRLLTLFPQPWSNDNSKQQGGILWTLFNAIGSQLSFIDNGIIYAQDTTRLATATDTSLDTWSEDFFGNALLRFVGESDTTFRKRIQKNLLAPAATRSAISNAILNLTFIPPRVMEPWSPDDTATYDYTSFWDIDQGGLFIFPKAPARWGDPTLRYQGFIESVTPSVVPNAGAQAVWALDIGAAYDIPSTGIAWFSEPTYLFQIQSVYDTINKIKAEGTIVWVRFIPAPLSAYGTGLYGQAGYGAQFSQLETLDYAIFGAYDISTYNG
jgi:hypothetical protein